MRISGRCYKDLSVIPFLKHMVASFVLLAISIDNGVSIFKFGGGIYTLCFITTLRSGQRPFSVSFLQTTKGVQFGQDKMEIIIF